MKRHWFPLEEAYTLETTVPMNLPRLDMLELDMLDYECSTLYRDVQYSSLFGRSPENNEWEDIKWYEGIVQSFGDTFSQPVYIGQFRKM